MDRLERLFREIHQTPKAMTPAEANLLWSERYLKYHIMTSGEDGAIENDDLLFFVRHPADKNHDPEERIVIKRRPADQTMAKVDFLVDWEESFYLNLLCQLRFVMRISVLSKGSGKLISKGQLAFPVFASPQSYSIDEEKGACTRSLYPEIVFTSGVAAEEEPLFLEMKDMLCVEVSIDFPSEDHVSASGSAFGALLPSNTLPVFQGALPAQQVYQSYQLSKAPHDPKPVTMRGPNGKGSATVNIAKEARVRMAEEATVKEAIRSLIKKGKRVPEVKCVGPFEVRVHWVAIITDLLAHFRQP